VGTRDNWYETRVAEVAARYESISAADVNRWLIDLLPPRPACVLDVGAGTGRDAAWLLSLGYEVLAVDPSAEMRAVAIGRHPDGRRWRIGIPDPDGEMLIETVQLGDEAIATSGGYGTRFDAEGKWHHIFDPATTRSAHRHRSVSVIAPTATEADALATAFAVMPERAAVEVAASLPNVRVRVVDNAGVARPLGT